MDPITESPVARPSSGIWSEKAFALVFPEIGGGIQVFQGNPNGHARVYPQDLIKPSAVDPDCRSLSGGNEFNERHHYRPKTALPCDPRIEQRDAVSKTQWNGAPDPKEPTKTLHGPGMARLVRRVRSCSRTSLPQALLWWANGARKVNESRQSFFPPDGYNTGDDAKRGTSPYLLCEGLHSGVDVAARARSGDPAAEAPRQLIPTASGGASANNNPASDHSFTANIPGPCASRCGGSLEDFYAGDVPREQAGLLHPDTPHISPGKTQLTAGNPPFSNACKRNLKTKGPTGEFRACIKVMAGADTDNQPDFSSLQPGETKTRNPYRAPLPPIGPAQPVNVEVAPSLAAPLDPAEAAKNTRRLGVADFALQARAGITKGKTLMLVTRDRPAVDARLLVKRDQHIKGLGASAAKRLRWLGGEIAFSPRRDGLNVDLCALYHQTGQPAQAESIVAAGDFRPWDNGKGRALGQYVRSPLLIGRESLAPGDFTATSQHFEHALSGPENRGESKHLFTHQRDRLFGLSAESCPTVGGDLAALSYLGEGLTLRDRWEWRQVALEPTNLPAESRAGGEGKNPRPSPAPAGARRRRLEITPSHSHRCSNRGSAEGDR